MSSSRGVPDYRLDERQVVNDPKQVKAIFHPLRGMILELLLERAASVQELAAAVGRPKSSVAYHVGVLADAGVLTVVRTRTVRGREESFYGRTARLFTVGNIRMEYPAGTPSLLETAARDAETAIRDDDFRGLTRYAWIEPAQAAAFWDRVMELVDEYAQLPRTRDGSDAYALLTAMYPTQHPRLAPGTPPAGSGVEPKKTPPHAAAADALRRQQ